MAIVKAMRAIADIIADNNNNDKVLFAGAPKERRRRRRWNFDRIRFHLARAPDNWCLFCAASVRALRPGKGLKCPAPGRASPRAR